MLNPLLLIFSLFFWIFSFSFMFILAVGTLIFAPIFSYQKIHHWIPAPGFAWIIRIATLGKFRVIFDPKFDPTRLSVYCMNHTNLLDAHAASAAIPQPFCGLMNAWQRHIPFYGWLMQLSKGILLDKSKGNVLHQMITLAKVRKSIRMSILTFPEAHRTLNGRIQAFKKGVFVMAREAEYPVVPLAARGMFQLNRKGSYLFNPAPVSIYVGPQFETKGLTDAQLVQLSEDVRQVITDYVEHEVIQRHPKAVNS